MMKTEHLEEGVVAAAGEKEEKKINPKH